MVKVNCDRRDCKNWVDSECSREQIRIEERTTSAEELAVCVNYDMVAAFC